MNSSRLPGKVLKKVLGRPLLQYLIERLSHEPKVQQIVVATTDDRNDEPIEEFCRNHGILCYRGSEADVLGRIFDAATVFGADPVLRLTADCPLLDVDVLSNQIDVFLEKNLDYCYLGLTFAEGVCADLCSYQILSYTNQHATLDEDREHVTPFMHKNRNKFRVVGLENSVDDSRYRFVVDRREDFEVVSAIINDLYRSNEKPFGMRRVKQYLDQNPEIYAINCDLVRNESYNAFRLIS